MMASTPGLLLARKYVQRVVLDIPALSTPLRGSLVRLYSTEQQHLKPAHKRPPKDLQVARQVLDGVESSKDSILKAYCVAKVKKNTPKKSVKEGQTADTNLYSDYDPDDILYFAIFSLKIKVFDFDHDMLAHFIAIKRKEGWSVGDCARAVEYMVHDWSLMKCLRFYGHFTRIYVELGENEEGETSATGGKWTPSELGELVGNAMKTREYSFMVDLLVKMVIGDGGHKTLLSNIKDERDAAYCFRGISKFYGVTLTFFPRWEFPFMGTVVKELATIPPKFAKHYYTWYNDDLGMDFSVDVLVQIAEQRRLSKGDMLLNPRLVGGSLSYIIENWPQEQKDKYKGKLYAKMDGNDNVLTYMLYKFARFLKIMKPNHAKKK